MVQVFRDHSQAFDALTQGITPQTQTLPIEGASPVVREREYAPVTQAPQKIPQTEDQGVTPTAMPTEVPTSPMEEEAPIETVTAPPPQIGDVTSIAPQAQIEVSPYTAPTTEYGSLFQPLTTKLGEQQEQLGQAATTFGTAVGAYPEFGEMEQGILETAIGPPPTPLTEQESQDPTLIADYDRRAQEYEQAWQDANKILSQQYAGPMQLSGALTGDQYLALVGGLEELRALSSTLNSVEGIEELLARSRPGLAPGIRREEALRLAQDPTFKQAAALHRAQITQAAANLQSVQAQAEQIGQQFGGYWDDMETPNLGDDVWVPGAFGQAREAAAGYLGSEAGEIMDPLMAQVAEEEEKQAAARALYDKIMGLEGIPGPDILQEMADLQERYPDLVETGGLSPTAMNTPAMQAMATIGNEWRSIMNDPKYDMIKDVPIMGLGITKRGRETLQFPSQWYQENKDMFTKNEWAEVKRLARERNKDLQAVIGKGTREPVVGEEGINYSTLFDMYYGQQPFEPIDWRVELTGAPEDDPDAEVDNAERFFSLDMGINPTPSNMATDEQKFRYNKIMELLDRAERLSEADPYRGAAITLRVGDYLDREEQLLQEREDELDEKQAHWLKLVHKARKEYRKNKHMKKIGLAVGIGQVVLGLLTIKSGPFAWGQIVQGINNIEQSSKSAGIDKISPEQEVKAPKE